MRSFIGNMPRDNGVDLDREPRYRENDFTSTCHMIQHGGGMKKRAPVNPRLGLLATLSFLSDLRTCTSLYSGYQSKHIN